MESCTGGYLVNSITEVPDSADYFKGGVVAYSQAMHMAHGVPAGVLQRYGVVSQENATAMAHAIRVHLGADVGIGVTGVLGPSPLAGKPVGLAYLAIVSASAVHAQEIRVPPRRVTIKRRVSNTALIELASCCKASAAHRCCARLVSQFGGGNALFVHVILCR